MSAGDSQFENSLRLLSVLTSKPTGEDLVAGVKLNKRQCVCRLCKEKLDDIINLGYAPKPTTDEELWDLLEASHPAVLPESSTLSCRHRHRIAYSCYFAHVVVSAEVVNELSSCFDTIGKVLGRPPKVIEVGAGLGLLARLVNSNSRVDIIATDLFNPAEALGWNESAKTYFPVLALDAQAAVEKFSNCRNILLVVWPLVHVDFPYRALKAFLISCRERKRSAGVVVVGERDHELKSEEFYELLEAECKLVRDPFVLDCWSDLETSIILWTYVTNDTYAEQENSKF